MKNTLRPRLPSDQRLARLSLWLALAIAWFAAHVLARLAPQAAARVLAEHARHARLILVVRAVKRAAFSPARRGVAPADIRRLTCRGVAGAALRHALRTGALRRRACAICDAIAAPEQWVALIVRRLKRGFTKLRVLPMPRRTRVRVIAQVSEIAHAINSS